MQVLAHRACHFEHRDLRLAHTATYSRGRGIAAWETCVEEEVCDTNENVEVLGSHSGLGYNLEALSVIADRLAQPAGAWRKLHAH